MTDMPKAPELLTFPDHLTPYSEAATRRAGHGWCPACSHMDLHKGPVGMAATNFACFSCRRRFNAAMIHRGGRIWFIEDVGALREEDRSCFSPNLWTPEEQRTS